MGHPFSYENPQRSYSTKASAMARFSSSAAIPRSISSLVTMSGGAMMKWLTQAWMDTPCAIIFAAIWSTTSGLPSTLSRMELKGRFVWTVLDQLNGEEKAESADVADGGMFGFEGFELLAHVGFEFRGALNELEALHLLDGGDSGAEGERMCLIRVPM